MRSPKWESLNGVKKREASLERVYLVDISLRNKILAVDSGFSNCGLFSSSPLSNSILKNYLTLS